MRQFTLAILSILILALSSPINARSFDEAYEAYQAGEYITAFEIWFHIAEAGSVGAQFNIALMYERGEGVKKNYPKAARWYEKAARQGDANAQWKLSDLYESGLGVLENNITAYMWHAIAKANGADVPYYLTPHVSNDEKAKALRAAKKCMESNYQDCD